MDQQAPHAGHAHEHTYVEIEGTENISLFEEQTHHQITLHWHPRGLALRLTYAEVMELADALQRVLAHIARGRRRNGG
ncbi:MAG TPA: hypothetical protein VKZ60_11020 [Chloroflexota bacterium]|jgi:hypothetical protein|nr:hypothetical protein [Chloroflexota bacterium]